MIFSCRSAIVAWGGGSPHWQCNTTAWLCMALVTVLSPPLLRQPSQSCVCCVYSIDADCDGAQNICTYSLRPSSSPTHIYCIISCACAQNAWRQIMYYYMRYKMVGIYFSFVHNIIAWRGSDAVALQRRQTKRFHHTIACVRCAFIPKTIPDSWAQRNTGRRCDVRMDPINLPVMEMELGFYSRRPWVVTHKLPGRSPRRSGWWSFRSDAWGPIFCYNR